jgi:CheY-like chemotaxis protein
MSDNSNPSKRELILSEDRSLAITKSGLVKRVLDLIHEQTKRHVQILLVSGREDLFDSLIIRGLKEKAGDKYDFEFVTAFKASEILELAQIYKFDIFILYLNNIPFHLDNFPVESQLDGSLQLVTHLKTTYRRPVVAFSSMADLEEEKVKRAGADFYFLTPYKVEDFLEAMIICLGRLS